MNSISRRRFLLDLSFSGGAIALFAGLAYAGKEQPTATPSPRRTPKNKLALPGEPMLPTSPTPAPTPRPAVPGGICLPPQTPSPLPSPLPNSNPTPK